jgi:DNA-binding transcriptional ArsR family regulator
MVINMGLPWKALSDNNRRQIMLLLKNKEMLPTQIAERLNFTIPAVSTSLRILRVRFDNRNEKGEKQVLFIEQEGDIRISMLLG